jgi:pilus assembly protein CpaC
VLLIAVAGFGGILHAQAPAVATAALAAAPTDPDVDSVRLLVGRSTVLDVGSPVARVSLTSSDVADALVTSPNQLLINGKLPGTISMFVWNRAGVLKRYEVIVQRDLARLSEQMRELFPGERIDVQSNGKNIVLSGSVSNKDVIERAVNVAAGYVDKRDEVVPLLQLQEGAPTNQVLLRVRFAEVSRSALTELGASVFTSPTGVENTLGRATTQQFSAPGYEELQYGKASSDFGSAVTSASGKFTFSDFLNLFLFSEKYDLGVMIRALQSKGMFQSLAEPNLVSESGKEASFLAGGEFPVPVAQGQGGNLAITVMFKEFGIRLNFTPVVNGDRIHLKVRPEVSTLDFANAILLNGFRIPALSTRRTETELELQNHQTFAIAGLLNNTANETLQKIPGIGDIPILGQLFRSKAAQKNQTELVVMITPEILPNNSTGAASGLPRTPQPFLGPLPEKGSVVPKQPTPLPQSSVVPSTPAPVNASTAKPAGASGAETLANLASTRNGSRIESTAPPTLVTTPEQPAPAAEARPLTEREQKELAKAHEQELKHAQELARAQAKADAKAKADEEKRLKEEEKQRKKQEAAAAKKQAAVQSTTSPDADNR